MTFIEVMTVEFRVDISEVDALYKQLRLYLSGNQASAAMAVSAKRAGVAMRTAASAAIKKDYKLKSMPKGAMNYRIIRGYAKDRASGVQLTVESDRLAVGESFKFKAAPRRRKPRPTTRHGRRMAAEKARTKRAMYKPITAEIMAGRTSKLHARAFTGKISTSGDRRRILWRDEGAPRNEIRQYRTLSVPQMVSYRHGDEVLNRGKEVYAERMQHELLYRLGLVAKGK